MATKEANIHGLQPLIYHELLPQSGSPLPVTIKIADQASI